ncbi:SDR family oxidoreductase [Amycolatopsis sp. 195334CR]|uniref:SDR family oxidoreductase n=1 Tax=Amycolatopsis sp. 195334CR TaxID=2814588 RepID=UPI001A8D7098|nr:NAD(P)H-binding protein [Amycolatopsis sp. 195334CR]MBN6034381.1 NAD(P)H-binding protein [Amycolatopsis sp. 195334CR]
MTILVTGARGSVARALIDQLLAEGEKVRASSSSPDVTVPDGVELVTGFDLTGVTKVFLYANAEVIPEFLAAASGIEHIVLLSSLASAEPEMAPGIAEWHLAAERPIEASGIPWTFLRPGAFATNTLAWAPGIRERGVAREAFPEMHLNSVHEQDIAQLALHALTRPGHAGKAYSLTGPESLSVRQHVDLIGAAIGRSLEVEKLPRAEATHLPDAALDAMEAAGTEPAPVGPTLHDHIGEPARTFATWATDHADDFR